MDALILAAGFSERLKPLTLARAKSLLPVGGRPMIDYVLEKIRAVPGVRRIFVVSNGRFCEDFLAWGRDHPGATIVNDGAMDNDQRLGAIRDIEFVIRTQWITEDLLIVAGDNLFEASLAAFVAEARAHDPCVSVGIVDLKDLELIRKRYGVVQRRADGRVTLFVEKPEHPPTTLISTGLYFFPAESLGTILLYLEQGGNPDNVGFLIRALVEDPGVHGALLAGRWLDIGDLKSYELADRTFRCGAEGEI